MTPKLKKVLSGYMPFRFLLWLSGSGKKDKQSKQDLCSRCKKNKAEAEIKGCPLCCECIVSYDKQRKGGKPKDVAA